MSDSQQRPLPIDSELGPVLRALRDLRNSGSAANGSGEPDDREESLNDPANCSPATHLVARRLVHIISSAQRESGETSNDVLQNKNDTGRTRAEPRHPLLGRTGTNAELGGANFIRVLNEELILLRGQALGAESLLPPPALFSIVSPLADFVAKAVYFFAIAHHLEDGSQLSTQETHASLETYLGASRISASSSSSAGTNRKSCHVWPLKADARRHVLRHALAAKYGSVEAAPTAVKFAGAPLVLYVRELSQSKIRIWPEELAFLSGEVFARYNTSLSEWKDIASGFCAFEVSDVKDAGGLRSQVSLRLKSAVKHRNLAPVLVVVNADLDATICGGLEVLRAVCDSYGACLHLEGAALGLLAAQPTILSSLQYNLSSCISQCHSMLFDIGAIFGLRNLAVVNYFGGLSRARSATGGEEFGTITSQAFASSHLEFSEGVGESFGGGEHALSRILALWWLFQRTDLSTARVVINAAAAQSSYLADNLCNVPHFIELRSIGCGANVLMSYSDPAGDPAYQTDVNRAVLKWMERHETMRHQGLCLAGYDDEVLILFSPVLALQLGCPVSALSCRDSDQVLYHIAAAARRCQISGAGASAFVASVRQCEHLELADMTAYDVAPLYFGAVRVVPLGLTAGYGNWRKEPDLIHQVEKLTSALVPGLTLSAAWPFECVLFDNAKNDCAPFVCVGPTEDVVTKSFSVMGNEKQGHHLLDDVTTLGSIRRELSDVKCYVEYARTVGREAGSAISQATRTLVRGLPQPSESLNYEIAGPASDNTCSQDHGAPVDPVGGRRGRSDTDMDHVVDVKSDPGTVVTLNDTPFHHRSSTEVTMEISQSSGRTVSTGLLPPASSLPLEGYVKETRENSRQDVAPGIWGMLFGGSGQHADDSDSEHPRSAGGAEQMDLFRP
jgi:hypothetical protein